MKAINRCAMLIFFAGMICYGSAGYGSTVRIAEDGKPLAVIVLPDEPERTVDFAAGELQSYLAKITGAEFPVVRESDVPDNTTRLLVGRSELSAQVANLLRRRPDDSFIVRADRQMRIWYIGTAYQDEDLPWHDIYLVGASPRGTLFAVYDFLERDLGCRWLGPGEVWEHVPRAETLDVSPARRLETPGFPYRQGRIGAEHGWCVKNKANMASAGAYPIHLDWYPERIRNRPSPPFELPGWSSWHSATYTILNVSGGRPNLERRKLMFSEHPEWFALHQDGSRRPTWLCHLNPESNDLLAERLSQLLREKPQMDFVQLGEGDGYTPVSSCHCEACLDMSAEAGLAHETSRGAYAYRWRLWENTVAALLAETDPEKKMMGVAYGGGQEPLDPEVIRPADNVMMELTSWSQCRAHGLEHEFEDETRLPEALSHADTRDWIERWSAQTPAGVSYMEYLERASMHFITAPIPSRFVHDTRYLRRQNVVGYRAGTGPNPFGFFIINVYAARKAGWNPDIDPDELVRDFCDHAFHEGSEHMQTFINVIEEAVKGSNCDHCRLVAWTMDKERMAEARRHLDAAREAVADNDAALQRLLGWDVHFQYAALAGPAMYRHIGALHNVYGVECDVPTLRAALEGYQAAADYAEAARSELTRKYGEDIMDRPDMRRIRNLGRGMTIRPLRENSPLRRKLAELESGGTDNGEPADNEEDED